MKIAYIILAYKNPEQVFRMINKLQSENTSFFLHIDYYANFEGFLKIPKEINQKRLHFSTKRFKTNWSSFGCVNALLHNMKTITESPEKFDFVITLTGQDYPIKNPAELENFLQTNRNNIFMSNFKLPSPIWKNGGIERVMSYHFNIFRKRILIKILHRSMIILMPFLPAKKLDISYDLYGGEAHFAFPIEIVNYILNFLNENPIFLNFFKHTYMPDEVIFQTLIMNSKHKNKVMDNTLKYIDWSTPEFGLPATMNYDYAEKIKTNRNFFARKFDVQKDSKILDYIDREIL